MRAPCRAPVPTCGDPPTRAPRANRAGSACSHAGRHRRTGRARSRRRHVVVHRLRRDGIQWAGFRSRHRATRQHLRGQLQRQGVQHVGNPHRRSSTITMLSYFSREASGSARNTAFLAAVSGADSSISPRTTMESPPSRSNVTTDRKPAHVSILPAVSRTSRPSRTHKPHRDHQQNKGTKPRPRIQRPGCESSPSIPPHQLRTAAARGVERRSTRMPAGLAIRS